MRFVMFLLLFAIETKAYQLQRSDIDETKTDIYRIQSGDSLLSISQKIYGTKKKHHWLLQANPGLNLNSQLSVNQVIKFWPIIKNELKNNLNSIELKNTQIKAHPPTHGLDERRTFTVLKQEGLLEISQKVFGSTKKVHLLFEANPGLNKNSILYEGQKLHYIGHQRVLQAGEILGPVVEEVMGSVSRDLPFILKLNPHITDAHRVSPGTKVWFPVPKFLPQSTITPELVVSEKAPEPLIVPETEIEVPKEVSRAVPSDAASVAVDSVLDSLQSFSSSNSNTSQQNREPASIKNDTENLDTQKQAQLLERKNLRKKILSALDLQMNKKELGVSEAKNLFVMVMALVDLNELELASQKVKEILAKSEKEVGLLSFAAQFYFKHLKDDKTAIELLEDAQQLAPNDLSIIVQQIAIFDATEQKQKAITHAQELIAKEPLLAQHKKIKKILAGQ